MTDAPPPYAAQPPAPGSRSKGLAIAALVLGLLGLLTSLFVVGGLFGLLAVILGIVGLRKANAGTADGKGLAIGGLVTGALAVVVAAAVLAVGGAFLARHGSDLQDLTTCLDRAGSDATAQQACQDEFNDRLGVTTTTP